MELKKYVDEISTSSAQQKAHNIIDGNEETCWFSSHSNEQFIKLKLNEEVYIKNIKILFQSGFHCKYGKLNVIFDGIEKSYKFNCKTDEFLLCMPINLKIDQIEFYFEKSYDLYGRYCIYEITIE